MNGSAAHAKSPKSNAAIAIIVACFHSRKESFLTISPVNIASAFIRCCRMTHVISLPWICQLIWRADTTAIMLSCQEFSIPAAVEISRSGNGAHIWIFFSTSVPAVAARRLGAALLSHACAHSRQLALEKQVIVFSPTKTLSQKGGFGNLIALPLQKGPRTQGNSVFVDEQFTPYEDQWNFLATLQKRVRRRPCRNHFTSKRGRAPA